MLILEVLHRCVLSNLVSQKSKMYRGEDSLSHASSRIAAANDNAARTLP